MVHLFPSNLGFNACIRVQGITVKYLEQNLNINSLFLLYILSKIQMFADNKYKISDMAHGQLIKKNLKESYLFKY